MKLAGTTRLDTAIQFPHCPPLHDLDGIERGASSVSPYAADTTGVLPIWIFQRGIEHLLLHCRENARGVTMVVSGDGDLRSYSFRDFAALEKFEGEMEEFLLETGWCPAQITIELTPDHVTPPQPTRRSRATF